MVCLVAGVLIAVVLNITKDKIEETEEAEVNMALAEIFPSAEFVEENGYYRVLENENFIGYAAVTEGIGPGGKIKLAIGVNLDGMIEGVHIISHSEAGVYSMVAEENFLIQFKGKSLEEVKLRKEGGKIDAVTGATMSSKAVVTIVHDELQKLPKML